MKTLTNFRLPNTLRTQFKFICDQENTSMTSVICNLLDSYIIQKQEKEIHRQNLNNKSPMITRKWLKR